ncbi:hypothetical protein [Streptomyces sp. XD-27]|uniref:hypothetical protein n=1 Tax=Streptomyces sp. XD-27 TaxID=3062779 RepID=UPI0026F43DBD|nr:hypothetical protein [Streptomyces sp. XD-27]WKX71822.1 hypothetical protein Q3Y56_19675 [Streptomyces sp. XD-27]
MRGLIQAVPGKTALLTGGSLVALVAAGGLVLGGCDFNSDGVRNEGQAQTAKGSGSAPDSYGSEPTAEASASPKPTGGARPKKMNAVELVKLVKADPKVNAELKDSLKPCEGDKYPVDWTYGALTGSARTDIVVNVLTCGDGMGIGAYVYRKHGDTYENVFADEEQAPLFADPVGKGELHVYKQLYAADASVDAPSGEEQIVYQWSADRNRFEETKRWTTDYNSNGDGEEDRPTVGDGTEG